MTEGSYALPPGWRWVKLGEVCEINPRRPRLIRDANTATSFIPMSAVDERTGIISDLQIRPFAKVRSGYTYFEEGDILFAKITPSMENGKAAIARGLIDGFGFGSTEFHVLRLGQNVISEWIWLFVRQERFRAKAKNAFRGAVGQQRVPQNFLEAYPIPLPPLPEQRRIVARIEELIERVREAKRLREEARQDADRLMQAALAEVFPRPGEELPPGWRWVKLGEVCEYKSGVWGLEASNPEDGFPIVRSTEIAGFRIKPETASIRCIPVDKVLRYALQLGDILVNKSSGSPHLVGWPAIFEDPGDNRTYLFSNFMLRLRVDKNRVEPWFVLYSLHSPMARASYLKAQNTTSGLRNLRIRDFIAQLIPLPSLEQQRRIVAHLDQIQARVTALKKAQEATEAELHRLEQAVLEKVFRGEL